MRGIAGGEKVHSSAMTTTESNQRIGGMNEHEEGGEGALATGQGGMPPPRKPRCRS